MTDPAARLDALLAGTDTATALELFDSLPAVRIDEVTGQRYQGQELPTGHPLDGVLEQSGWYGKRFVDAETVDPLLFTTPDGSVFAVDPRKVPLGLADKVPAQAVAAGRKALGVAKPALQTKEPRARLRHVEHRGVVTVAMVYDHLPIIDVFRRVDAGTLLGIMDLRGVEQPYFFVLRADGAVG